MLLMPLGGGLHCWWRLMPRPSLNIHGSDCSGKQAGVDIIRTLHPGSSACLISPPQHPAPCIAVVSQNPLPFFRPLLCTSSLRPSPGRKKEKKERSLLPRLAPWATSAVRADARDTIYLSSGREGEKREEKKEVKIDREIGYIPLAAALYLLRSLGFVRACPGSACISLVWLERCTTSLSLFLTSIPARLADEMVYCPIVERSPRGGGAVSLLSSPSPSPGSATTQHRGAESRLLLPFSIPLLILPPRAPQQHSATHAQLSPRPGRNNTTSAGGALPPPLAGRARRGLRAGAPRGARRGAAMGAAEACAFNYVVSAARPSAVSHSAVGRFTRPGDLNLIIACAPPRFLCALHYS